MCPVNTLPNSTAYLSKNGKSVTSNFRTLHVSPKAYSSVFQLMHTHDKWPYKIENAFTSALRTIIKTGTSKIKIRNKNYGRNELISLYIKYETGEVRTKKQISSHIQVWKKSILNKISNHMFLTPFDTEMLNLIERGAEQNERTLSHFYALFEKIIDTLSKCETITAGLPASSTTTKNITGINSTLVSGPSGVVEHEATVSDTNSTTSTGVFSTASAPATDVSTDLSASDTSVEAVGKSAATRPQGSSVIGSTPVPTTHYYHDYVSGGQPKYRSSMLVGKSGKHPLELHGNKIDTKGNDNGNVNSTLTTGLRGLFSNNSKPYYSLEDISYSHGTVTIPPLASEPIQPVQFSKGMRVVSNPETTSLTHVTTLPRPTLKRTMDSDFTIADYDNNTKRIKLPPVYRNSSNSSSSVSISTTSSRIPSGASIASNGSSSSSSSSVTSGLDSPIDPKSVILPSLYQSVHQSFTTTDSYLHPQIMHLRSGNNATQILPGPKVQPLNTFPQQMTTLNHVPITSIPTTTQRRFSRGGVDILPPLRNMKLRGENRNVTLQTTDFGTPGATTVAPAAFMQVSGGVYKLDEIKRNL